MIPEKFLDFDGVSEAGSTKSTQRSEWRDNPMSQNKRALKDPNFYRKVSKYDLDKLDVDWNAYIKERDR